MKKKGIMLILAVMSIIITLVPVSLASVASTGQSDLSAAEVTKINGVLNDVLSSELNIVKTGKAEDYSSVINDNGLLQLVQKEEQFKKEWYNDINFKIYDYTSNVKINNVIKLSDNDYVLDLTYQAELILGKDLQIHPQMSDNYVCEIENKSGQWVIDKLINRVDYQDIVKENDPNNTINIMSINVSDADILAKNDSILNSKVKDLDARSANINTLVNNYNGIMKQTKNKLSNGSEEPTPDSIEPTPLYAGTNRTSVADYAEIYSINHNTTFYYYDGEDCTNFVSQAVWAGGVPWDVNGLWYCYTPNWVNVVDFCNYMVSAGYVNRVTALDSSDQNGIYENIVRGDIIQWKYWYADYSHSTVATYLDSTYGWLLSAHSNDRCNYPMSMYYGDFSYARALHFW